MITHLRTLSPDLTSLLQLSKFSNITVNSTTKVLPAWKRHLKALVLPVRVAPRIVKTRWNSTFDMVVVTINYKKAYKRITEDAELSLRGFELSKREWAILEGLRDILKVRWRLCYQTALMLSLPRTTTPSSTRR